MRSNEIEARAIYEYLRTGLFQAPTATPTTTHATTHADERAAEVAIDIMRRNWNNPAYRPLKSIRKLGPLIIFIKRLIRRCLLKWYVEPICAQQAIFNEATLNLSVILNEEALQHKADTLELNARMQQQQQETVDLIATITSSIKSMTSMYESAQQQARQQAQQQEQRFADLNAALARQAQRVTGINTDLNTALAQQAQQVAAITANLDAALAQQAQQVAAITADISHHNQWALDVNARAQERIQRIDTLEADGRQHSHKIAELEQRLLRQNEHFKAAQNQLSQLENYGVFSDRHPSYEKQSFSQTGEDMILSFIFSELRIPLSQVFYLDLGANHAKLISNTYYFYQQGARGVLVEANPALVPELKLYRSDDVVLNRCIADKSGEKIPFYIIGNGDGLSTVDKETAESVVAVNAALSLERVVEVETITVSEIIDQYFDDAPVLLNIDIEGKEEDVLRAIDFTRCRPAVIVCEMIPYSPNALNTIGQKNEHIQTIMRENDYTEYAFTGINAIFIDHKRLRGEQT